MSIKFDAKLSEVENLGAKLNVVKVYISKNGILIDSLVTQNGRAFYNLDSGAVYKIEFSKTGYVSKYLVVNTTEPPAKIKSKSTLKVDVSLFKNQEGLDVSFLKTKAIGVAQFNPFTAKLEWDVEYTRIMVQKIIDATLIYYQEKESKTP